MNVVVCADVAAWARADGAVVDLPRGAEPAAGRDRARPRQRARRRSPRATAPSSRPSSASPRTWSPSQSSRWDIPPARSDRPAASRSPPTPTASATTTPGNPVRHRAISWRPPLDGCSRSVSARGRADGVEDLHVGEAVGEGRDRDRGRRRGAVDAGAQRLAQPRVRAELEVGEAVRADRPTAGGAGSRRSAGTGSDPASAARRRSRRRSPSSPSVPSVPATHGHPDDVRRPRRGRLLQDAVDADCIVNRTTNVSSAHVRARGHRRQRRARPSRTRRTSTRSWSTTCDPDAPSHPPPRAASNHQSGVRARRDRRRAGRTARACTVRGSPIMPLGDRARASVARSGAHRNSWPTRCVTPARVAAASIVAASVASSANGFSQST